MSDPQTGDLYIVVDEMPSGGTWGHPFIVNPDTWLVKVEPDYEAMRRAWDVISPCYCGPEYTDRGLISPHCDNHLVQEELEMLWNAAVGGRWLEATDE